jgi:hypothetical protein
LGLDTSKLGEPSWKLRNFQEGVTSVKVSKVYTKATGRIGLALGVTAFFAD